MTDDSASDPDRPRGSGPLAGLQLRAGRIAIAAAVLLRPRVSLGVRLLALDALDRVLLVRHSYLPGLHLPGGAVGPGESCRDAAVREAREEGGVEIGAAPELFHVYWNRALRGRDHVVLFVARDARQAEARPASLEVVAAGFHPAESLPDDVTPATRARIDEVLNRRPPPDIW